MNKRQAKQLFLSWLDEATLNGCPPSPRMTADLEAQFDALLPGAVSFLAGFFKLPRQAELQAGVPDGPYLRYPLPPDFREMDRVVCLDGGDYQEAWGCQVQGGALLAPARMGKIRLLYFAEPAPLPPSAPAEAKLDLPARAAYLVPLKCAADALAGNEEKAGLAHYLEAKLSAAMVQLLEREAEQPRTIAAAFTG